MGSIWIPNSISNCTAQSQGGVIYGNEWERAYHIWEHARILVDNASNDFSLADGVANLKRALNHRLKLIEEIYSFKKIEVPNKPKGSLELLEYYGIVRPYLMKVLLNIRNEIEHNDANPPVVERCKEFVDIVWYFLKSTDSITRTMSDNPLFNLIDENGLETHYWYSAEIDFKKAAKVIQINGWFPQSIIYDVAKEDASEVIVETMHTKKEKWCEMEEQKEQLDTDIWLVGELLPSPVLRLTLIKKLLTCY